MMQTDWMESSFPFSCSHNIEYKFPLIHSACLTCQYKQYKMFILNGQETLIHQTRHGTDTNIQLTLLFGKEQKS